MNEIGISRRVDDLGRIVIPKEIRRSLGIREGSEMELFVSDEGVMLKKYYPENELSEMVQSLMESVEDMRVTLGSEKTGDIRRHIREIQNLLNQGN